MLPSPTSIRIRAPALTPTPGLHPWYEEPGMAHIGPQMREEEAAITKRAVAAYEDRKAARGV